MGAANKKYITNLQGIWYPSIFKAQFNVEETLYDKLFEIVGPSVDKMIISANTSDKNGFANKASDMYQGICIYYYLIQLFVSIKHQIDTLGINFCEASENLNIQCVLDSLACLSKKYNTNYIKVWEEFIEYYEYPKCINSSGEFNPCDFEKESFSKPIGSVYGKCENI